MENKNFRAVGLFTFTCLIAAISNSLPTWLIVMAMVSIASRFWRDLRIPPGFLYCIIVVAYGYLLWDANKIWHRTTATSAFVIATLYYVLAPAHKHQIMRFHAGLFSLLISVLIIPSETYPLPVYLTLTLLVCISLVAHHTSFQNTFALLSLGRTIGRLALPLSLIMVPIYYFFPDIEAPRPRGYTSGIANELEPGKISSLALSDKLAFRARFPGPIPSAHELYWRTDVFEEGRGLRWTRGSSEIPQTFITNGAKGLAYELMLDDVLNGLIPTLEHSVDLRTHDDEEITVQERSRVARSNSTFISGTSQLADHFPAEEPKLRELEDSSDRVMQLVNELKKLSPTEQISRVTQLFQGFQYSLNPGLLTQDDKLDEFLFVSKKGYCEHFAASFATLLRMAGTPARVVVGFAGGARLSDSGYFQVNNSSAHAWVEVWYDKAWHRVDPSSFAIGGEEIGLSKSNILKLAVTWLSFQSEHLLVWVREWAADIGLIWTLLGVTVIGLLSLQIYRVTHKKAPIPRYEKLTLRLLRRLESKGYIRQPGETIAQFLKRPSLSFSEIGDLYNQAKFGEDKSLEPQLIKMLKSKIQDSKKIPRI